MVHPVLSSQNCIGCERKLREWVSTLLHKAHSLFEMESNLRSTPPISIATYVKCLNVEKNNLLKKVIDLSSHTLSEEQIQLLSLGLDFCVDEHMDLFELLEDLQLFTRNLLLKALHTKPGENEPPTFNFDKHDKFTVQDFRSLNILQELHELLFFGLW